jgi:Zn-dependent metalloprotease
MSRRSVSSIVVLAALIFGGLAPVEAVAAPPVSAATKAQAVARLRADASSLRISQHDGNHVFIASDVPASQFTGAGDARSRALNYVKTYGAAFGVSDAAKELRTKSSSTDSLGVTHVKMDQTYQGLPVLGQRLIVHVDADGARGVNGEFLAIDGLSTAPRVSQAIAEAKAVHSRSKDGARRSGADTELVVYPLGVTPHLAWRVSTVTMNPVGLWRTFVDAHTGQILASYNDVRFAKNRQVSSMGNDIDCNLDGAPACDLPGSSVRTEGSGASGDAEANAVYTTLGLMYDFLSTDFSRDSYDDAGHQLLASVNFGGTGTSAINNAFWCPTPDCSAFYATTEQWAFGEGDGTDFGSLAQDADVVSHEFTHALTGATAEFLPYGQAGALDESYADVFAALRSLAASETDPWLIGETATIVAPGYLRNLIDPNAANDPDTMNEFIRTSSDNGWIHGNSTIMSHAAYQTYNRFVTEIGATDALDHIKQIYYRALTEYLTPAADFRSNLQALWQSAFDLYGSQHAGWVAAGFGDVGVYDSPAVLSPSNGETFKGGTSVPISLGTAASSVAPSAFYGRPTTSGTYTQGFESTTLPTGFTSSGDALWAPSTADFTSGLRSVKSGAIGDSASTELKATRTFLNDGKVTFAMKVDTEEFYDNVSMFVDNELVLLQSGDIDWGLYEINVPAGTHTLRWLYERDSTDDITYTGSDTVWIDDLSATNSPLISWTAVAGDTMTAPTTSSSAYRMRLTTGSGSGMAETIGGPFTVDATGPTTTVATLSKFQTTVKVKPSWTATDTYSGVASYDVRVKVLLPDGTLYDTFDIATYTTQTSDTYDFTGFESGTLCFSARARDGVGNVGAYSAYRCTALPFDDRNLSRSSGWTLGSGSTSSYYDGTFAYSTKTGAYLKVSGVRYKTLALVAQKCSSCGKVQLYRGSSKIGPEISLYSSTTKYRQVITVATSSSLTSSALITIKVISSGKPVRIDGLGVLVA